MPRVIVLVSRLREGKGGVAAYFRSLENAQPDYVRYLSIGGKSVQRKAHQVAFDMVRDAFMLRNVLREPDVEVLHLNPSLVWKAMLRDGLHVLIGKWAKKKVLVFWHGWDWTLARQLRGKMLGGLFRSVYGRVDCHIVLAGEFREFLKGLGCHAPIICESTVVGEELLHVPARTASRESMDKEVRLLFLSRVEKEKGIYVAIDTVTELRKGGWDATLVVAGDGRERSPAEKYVETHALRGISFAGYLGGEDKKKVLAMSDIFLFPSSHGEGMPLSVLEAMAAGLPVLCTRVGGLVNFFKDGEMGFSFNEASAGAFAEVVEWMMANPEKARSIGDHNRHYALRHFQPTVVARRVSGVYEFLFSGSSEERVPPNWTDYHGMASRDADC